LQIAAERAFSSSISNTRMFIPSVQVEGSFILTPAQQKGKWNRHKEHKEKV
jgi:hypothetical protein